MAGREIEAKRIPVRLDIPADDPPRLVDPDQLVQAGLNVVLNAVQAMPEGGVLTVGVTASSRPDGSDGGVRLSFADNGPGIPDSAKDKVFNPFFILRKDGTGLGLAIVHKIIQDHGGTIDVGDNQPNGAVVTFVLPGAVS
ncbi:MAG: ATP-binding protein [Planctomycetaceae bacterium]|nr:ATP-binding protein [Planctomycetaceae bacterium]